MEKAWELAAVSEDNKDELEVSIGSSGAKIALKGGAVSGTSRGLGDLFKPFVNWAGSKGDEIEHKRNINRQIRIFNEDALKHSLETASNEAKRRGIPIKPVPIKFLAQWAEGASMENVNQLENLSEMWANLLISKSAGSLENSQIFVGIIKKLNWEHKKALEQFVELGLSGGFSGVDAIGLAGEMLFSFNAKKSGLNLNITQLSQDVCKAFRHKKGVLVKNVNVTEIQRGARSDLDIHEYIALKLIEKSENDQSMDIDLKIRKNTLLGLQSLNLIQMGSKTGLEISETQKLNVFFWFLTEFGREFLNACLAKVNASEVEK